MILSLLKGIIPLLTPESKLYFGNNQGNYWKSHELELKYTQKEIFKTHDGQEFKVLAHETG